MKREIFRTAALNRMSSPEQLDQMLQVSTPKYWMALLSVGLVLLFGLAWGFFGRMTTKASGRGVILRSGGQIVVGAVSGGRIESVAVRPGDVVHSGQVLAVLAQPLLLNRIRVTESALAELQAHQGHASGVAIDTVSLEQQRQLLEDQIKSMQQEQTEIDSELSVEVAGQSEAKHSLRNRSADIDKSIAMLRAQQAHLRTSGSGIGIRLTDLQAELAILRADFDRNSKVTAPYNGEVVQVEVVPGALVVQGGSIVDLQPHVDEMEVVAYVPAAVSKTVQPGNEVEIALSSLRVEDAGYMHGRVVSISTYPATDEELMSIFHNGPLARALSSGGPVNEVHVEMEKDSSTVSGYRWSTRTGLQTRITPGTLCAVSIVTREERPLRLLIPFAKGSVGINY